MNDEFIQKRKIAHMSGTKLTPEVVLARTLEKAPSISAVCVIIKWDDDTFAMDWSSMTMGEFALCGVQLEEAIRQVFFREDHHFGTEGPESA